MLHSMGPNTRGAVVYFDMQILGSEVTSADKLGQRGSSVHVGRHLAHAHGCRLRWVIISKISINLKHIMP